MTTPTTAPSSQAGTARFSLPAIWAMVWDELKGTDYRPGADGTYGFTNIYGEPDRYKETAAAALVYVYNETDQSDETVSAVLMATGRLHNTTLVSPAEVTEMADLFLSQYDDFATPAQQWLDEHDPDIRWEWLNETGRRGVEPLVRRESEFWLDDPELPGVWVFKRPGWPR